MCFKSGVKHKSRFIVIKINLLRNNHVFQAFLQEVGIVQAFFYPHAEFSHDTILNTV